MNGYNKNNNRMEYDEKRDNFDLDFGFTQTDNSFPDFGIDSTYENNPARDYNFPAQDFTSPTQDYNSPAQDYNSPAQDYNSPTRDYNSPARDFNSPAQDLNSFYPGVPVKNNGLIEEGKLLDEIASLELAGKQKKPPPTPPIAYKVLLTSYGIMLLACIILAFLGEAWSFCALLPIMAFTFQFFYCHHPRNRTKPAVISLFLEAAAISAVCVLRMSFPENFKAMSRNIIGSFFGMGAACVGIALIIGFITREVICRKRCTTLVDAMCIGIVKIKHVHHYQHHGTSVSYSYHPVYEFDFEGAHYKFTGESLGNKEADPKNKPQLLAIDPENPLRFIEQKKNSSGSGLGRGGFIAILFIGLFFAIMGIFVFCLTLDPGLDIMAK